MLRVAVVTVRIPVNFLATSRLVFNKINDLGAVAWAVAPKLFCEDCNFGVAN